MSRCPIKEKETTRDPTIGFVELVVSINSGLSAVPRYLSLMSSKLA